MGIYLNHKFKIKMAKLLLISLFVMSCYITASYGNPVNVAEERGIKLETVEVDAMTHGNHTEMIENPDDNGVLTRSVGQKARNLWPNGVVPFTISNSFTA